MFSFPTFLRNQRARRPRRQQPRRRGSATVETALCLTFVLLPVTLGAFQLAMVSITSHSLQQVARESARWAAVHYKDDTFDDGVEQGSQAGQPRSLLNYMRSQAAANGIAWADINGGRINKKTPSDLGEPGGSIVITPVDNQRVSGQPITIAITYPMRQRAFLGALFFKSDDNKKLSPLQLGFLKSNWVEASTTLME